MYESQECHKVYMSVCSTRSSFIQIHFTPFAPLVTSVSFCVLLLLLLSLLSLYVFALPSPAGSFSLSASQQRRKLMSGAPVGQNVAASEMQAAATSTYIATGSDG